MNILIAKDDEFCVTFGDGGDNACYIITKNGLDGLYEYRDKLAQTQRQLYDKSAECSTALKHCADLIKEIGILKNSPTSCTTVGDVASHLPNCGHVFYTKTEKDHWHGPDGPYIKSLECALKSSGRTLNKTADDLVAAQKTIATLTSQLEEAKNDLEEMRAGRTQDRDAIVKLSVDLFDARAVCKTRWQRIVGESYLAYFWRKIRLWWYEL